MVAVQSLGNTHQERQRVAYVGFSELLEPANESLARADVRRDRAIFVDLAIGRGHVVLVRELHCCVSLAFSIVVPAHDASPRAEASARRHLAEFPDELIAEIRAVSLLEALHDDVVQQLVVVFLSCSPGRWGL